MTYTTTRAVVCTVNGVRVETPQGQRLPAGVPDWQIKTLLQVGAITEAKPASAPTPAKTESAKH